MILPVRILYRKQPLPSEGFENLLNPTKGVENNLLAKNKRTGQLTSSSSVLWCFTVFGPCAFMFICARLEIITVGQVSGFGRDEHTIHHIL